MLKLIFQSLRQLLVWTVLLGLLYPVVVTLLAEGLFRPQAEGSWLVQNGRVVGSELLGQQFTSTKYFWSRPSACNYSTVPSAASNLGPTSGQLRTNVMNQSAALRAAHGLATNAPVPADLLFASGSGVDPHISPEAARFQIVRVATARGLATNRVASLVEQFVEGPQFGFLGEPRVNVLKLNLALDALK
jgi:potassium-transporting ATPase KdpC subunit